MRWRAAIELCREIGGQVRSPNGARAELYPGPECATPARLRDYIRGTAITYHHQVGTCKMGVDELAVVDPELRVYGVDGSAGRGRLRSCRSSRRATRTRRR